MSVECNICVELYTKQTRKKIVCNNCEFEACLSCMKTHFKTSEKEPSCMNCLEKFSEEFLYDNFPKAYINKDIKQMRQNLLLESEKQLLPATQEQVKYHKYVKTVEENMKMEEIRISSIIKELNTLTSEVKKKRMLFQIGIIIILYQQIMIQLLLLESKDKCLLNIVLQTIAKDIYQHVGNVVCVI